MLFPTIDFAIFFAVAYVANWLLNPFAAPWKMGMIALSYYFYAWWDWRFVFLLAASTTIAGLGAAMIHRLDNPAPAGPAGPAGSVPAAAASAPRALGAGNDRARRWVMIASVVGLLGLLGYFKYYGFASSNLDNFFHSVGLGRLIPIAQPMEPVAVSFFTFMAVSYVIDVYRRQLEPSTPIDLAVYLSFFPHLIAGPIVRGSELLPQIRHKRNAHAVEYPRALWMIMAGLFKKVVISTDMANWIVNPVFASPNQHSGLEVIFAAWGYAIQIYCDFSGYTDIAIGLALLLGFQFPVNFDAPYSAVSLQDFWRRWHITLSRWLRDYLYIPLGGNRGSQWRVVRNIMITMVLGGLWHGANWTFIIWGSLHGVGQAVAHVRRRWHDRQDQARREQGALGPHGSPVGGAAAGGARGQVSTGLAGTTVSVAGLTTLRRGAARVWWQRFWTFQYVCLGWVFFNASSFSNAMALLGRLFTGWGSSPLVTPLLVVTIALVLASQFVPSGTVSRLQGLFARQRTSVQVGLLGASLLVITTLGPSGVAPFIYYRF